VTRAGAKSEGRALLRGCIALVATLAACDSPGAGADANAHAGAGANAGAHADEDPSARMAAWNTALRGAQTIPCRAIAVDGPVQIESDPDAGAPAFAALALHGEIPTDTWLALGPASRLVAKDPRTTRETAFVGPARVRPCVAHREESWIAAGRFESAVGAGETPGAEEWAVTPFGVARYMSAQLHLDVREKDATVDLGTGVAFLWLADDVREAPPPRSPRRASDASDGTATTAIDDDGWRRMTAGSLALARTGVRPPADAARTAVEGCVGLTKTARDLAADLLSGLASHDGGVAKEQLKTRRIARAACAIAAIRVDTLPVSKARTDLAARLDEARGVRPAPAPGEAGAP
jgi:hypothetical protein